MFPSNYGAIFKAPDYYHPPDDISLAANTEYPNLNSRDYAKRGQNRLLRIHPAWECLVTNVDGTYALGTNKLTGREWSGTLWGFDNRESIGYENKSDFKLQCSALITAMQFVANNILLVAFESGSVQLWSTKTEIRTPYCMFMIGECFEHTAPILCLDQFPADHNKSITGGKDCMLKIWDTGKADLESINTMRYAHSDIITGVAASPGQANIFASCAFDKLALLWDDRQARPATAIYENHSERFKAISWASSATSPDEKLIHIGDEDGSIITCDIRKPNEIIEKITFYDRAVRKLRPNGSLLAVIGDTNVVKAFKGGVQVYESSEAQHFVRDVLWTKENEFLTVGYDGKLRTHVINDRTNEGGKTEA